MKENKIKRSMERMGGKFNSPDDFFDYKISVYHKESLEMINAAFKRFIGEVDKILETDRATISEDSRTAENS